MTGDHRLPCGEQEHQVMGTTAWTGPLSPPPPPWQLGEGGCRRLGPPSVLPAAPLQHGLAGDAQGLRARQTPRSPARSCLEQQGGGGGGRGAVLLPFPQDPGTPSPQPGPM